MKRTISALCIVPIFVILLALSACSGLQPGPDTAQKYHDQGVLNLTAAGEKRDPEKAVEYFTQAIKAEPNFAKSYNARGVAYVLLGEYDQARSDFEQALEMIPANVPARENLDHLRAGEYDLVTKIEY